VEDRLDELSLENHRLRARLRSLTVIMVLFMLAVGGIAGAVFMKVREPHEHDPPSSLVLNDLRLQDGSARSAQLMRMGDEYSLLLMGAGTGADQDQATLRPQSLQITTRAGSILIKDQDGQPAITFIAGNTTTTLTAARLAELLAPPPPPPAPTPTPTPTPTPEPAAPAPP
jgi:hypothetical protein